MMLSKERAELVLEKIVIITEELRTAVEYQKLGKFTEAEESFRHSGISWHTVGDLTGWDEWDYSYE